MKRCEEKVDNGVHNSEIYQFAIPNLVMDFKGGIYIFFNRPAGR